ncbi:asparagine synthase [Encephalitozoon cuniculi EcunIII-L]|nr:asparagine synthase [Encephalitozoon cuniculi EcunIII-L]
MCGIFLSEDKDLASEEMALLIGNRGGDHSSKVCTDGVVAISSVLSIRGSVGQPVLGAGYLFLYNGEIYNGDPSDTLFIKHTVDRLLQECSGLGESEGDIVDRIYEEINRHENEMAVVLMLGDRVYFFKDDIGRRSLGYGLDPFYVSSVGYTEEVNPMLIYSYNKATRRLDEWPKNSRIVKRYISLGGAILSRLCDAKYSKKYQYLRRHLVCGKVEGSRTELNDVNAVISGFSRLFRRSVERRILEGNVCVFFSGGVDSMLVAVFLHYVASPQQKIYLINTSFGPSWDRDAGRRGFEELCSRFGKRSFVFVPNDVTIEEVRAAKEHIYRLIYPKSGPMDFNIGATLFFTARESRKYGRVAYLGSGADEMFGGYHKYKDSCFREDMMFDLFTISHHNLCRDDRVISDSQVECRFPFLDSELVEYSLEIGSSVIMMNGERKFVIREVLRRNGLGSASTIPKKAMQYGSGMSKIEGKI